MPLNKANILSRCSCSNIKSASWETLSLYLKSNRADLCKLSVADHVTVFVESKPVKNGNWQSMLAVLFSILRALFVIFFKSGFYSYFILRVDLSPDSCYASRVACWNRQFFRLYAFDSTLFTATIFQVNLLPVFF